MRRSPSPRRPMIERLEDRLCLSGTQGWDGPGQHAVTLKYYIGPAPAALGQAAATAAIQTALAAWSSAADITFVPTSAPHQLRALDFTFGRIDGKGGTLAEGYFPDDVNPAAIAGDVEFDSSEAWEVGNARKGAAFDLVLTAAHEIGHALGLDHSRAPGSVMAPSISPNQQFVGLAAGDVAAIQSLYAPAKSSGPPVATTPTTPPTTTTPIATSPTPTRHTTPRIGLPWNWRWSWLPRFVRQAPRQAA